MATIYRFFHRARVRAPIAVAWDVFTSHERIGEFTNMPTTIRTPGETERNGLGCIRTVGVSSDLRIDEIVNIWRPHEVFGYHVIDSPMMDAHQGIVRFFPTGEGCEWVYDLCNTPSQPVLDQTAAAGISYQDFFGNTFKEYVADIEAECERRADGERIPAIPPSTSDHAIRR